MIDLTAKIDNDEALRKLRQLQQTAKQTTSSVVTDADRMDMAMARLGRTLGQIGVGISLTGLVRQVGQVRGEFQKLEIAFSTMLQSEAKAKALMSQLTRTAATTPFGLQDVANGAKQLLAYGTSAEKVNDTLLRLGDIAAGLSIPLGDLVYLYGTTQTQGRLFTQDLRQFQGRGIPLAEELAKQFKVTSAEVGKLVTAGKVGFPEVEKAIISMTSEGGKFGGLMEAQSKTINGLVSNLEDAFDMMFNEIGQKTEGAFVGVLKTSIELVENYEKVIDILVPLVATYGSYKAALIVVAAAHKVNNAVLREAVLIKKAEIAAGRAVTKAQAVQLAQTKLLTNGWRALTTSIKASSVALLTSPVTWITVALAGLSYGIYKVVTAETAQEKAQRKVNEAMEDYKAKQEELKTKAEELHGIMNDDATTAYQQEKAYRELIKAYPELLDKYDKEKILLMDIVALRKEIAGITDTRDRSFVEANYKQALADYNYYNEGTGRVTKLASKEDVKAGEAAYVGEQIRAPRDYNKAQAALELSKQYKKQLEEIDRIQAESASTDDKIAKKQAEINRLKEEEKQINQDIADAQKSASGDGTNKTLIPSAKSEDVLQAQKQANINRQKELELEIKNLKEGQKTTKTPLSDKEQKRLKKIADINTQLQLDAAQAEVDAMKEGALKVLAQIDLDYDQREAEIKKREAELKALQGGKLTDEQMTAFGAMRRGNESERTSKRMSAMYTPMDIDLGAMWEAEMQSMRDYLKEYGSWEEKRLAITEDYQAKIEQATNEWDIKSLTKQMEKALDDLDESMLEKSDLWTRLFADASRMTRSQLKQVIADTKKLLDYLDGSSTQKPNGFTDDALENLKKQPDVIKDIYDALNEKQREFDENNKYPFSNIINGINAMREAHKLEQKAADATDDKEKSKLQQQALHKKGEALNFMQAGAAGAASALSDLSQRLQEVADNTSNDNLKESAEQLSAVAQNFSAAAQGFAQGGWIGAIVGGVTDMLNQTIEAFANDRAEREEERQNALDFAREYTMLMLSLKEEDYETLFGTHGLEMAIDAYKKAKEALLEYSSIVNKVMDKPAYDDEANSLGSLVFGGMWLGKSQTDLSAKLMEAYKKGYTKLQAMMVKTLDRSGWANFWGKKDRYTALKDLAKELWDEDTGEFNVDAAKAFLETNTQINDEQRKQIEHVIELREQYDSLIAEIDKQIAGVFGDLATDLTDIIFDSVRNGTDAWDAFNERGSEVINNLGKQMVQEMFVQAYLDQWVESLRDAFGGENVQDVTSKIAEITKQMFGGMGHMFEGATAAASAWDEAAKAAGWDVESMAKGQEATAKGFQTMDQETGSELNGRFTDMQGKMAEQLGLSRQALERIEYIRGLSEQQLNTQIDTRDILINISGNVSEIRTFTESIPLIHEAVTKTNKILDERL